MFWFEANLNSTSIHKILQSPCKMTHEGNEPNWRGHAARPSVTRALGMMCASPTESNINQANLCLCARSCAEAWAEKRGHAHLVTMLKEHGLE
eukprot:4107859-Amphidinium_carterae.1